MFLRKWEDLPENMKTPEVKRYYDILTGKRLSLGLKRAFDIAVSLVLLVILAVPMLVIAILILLDSPGGALYRQVRITAYGKTFRIHKFRTMVANADQIGGLVTVGQDARITKIGRFLRKYRLDELPQVLDVLAGNMSYVGTRPEVPEYVAQYTDEMRATLLLPAGVTSLASIYYKDEAALLDAAEEAGKVYIEDILPQKMAYNLSAIRDFSFRGDIRVMFMTVFAVLGREYRDGAAEQAEDYIRQ